MAIETCGIPSLANWHTLVIVGKGDAQTGTETDYFDLYECEEHFTEREVGDAYGDGWEVLESTSTHLRDTPEPVTTLETENGTAIQVIRPDYLPDFLAGLNAEYGESELGE